MKDAIKLILEIIMLGKAIFKEYRRAKVQVRKSYLEGRQGKDLDALRRLNLGRDTKP